jgi:hypothetical protein
VKPVKKTFTKPEQQKSRTTKIKILVERTRDERNWIKEEIAEYQSKQHSPK